MFRRDRFTHRMRDRFASAGDVFGRQFLLDAATGLVLPFSYSRPDTGPAWWLPQQDGSMASFGNTSLPRSFVNGAWGYEFHPGWTQHVKASHALTDLGNWGPGSWVTVSDATGVVAPDGGTPSRIVPTATSSTDHLVSQAMSTLSAGTTYCSVSVVKADGYNFWRHRGLGVSGSGGVCFNLAAGTVVSLDGWQSAGVIPLRDGWKMCWSVANAAAAVAPLWHVFPTASFVAYSGDGTSGVLVRALNFTNTAYPVPVTAATAAVGTVGNHSMSATTAALGLTLGSECGLGVEAVALNRTAGKFPSMLALRTAAANSSSTTAEFFINPGAGFSAIVKSAGVDQFASYNAANTPTKFAMRVKANDFRAAFAGTLSNADTSGSVPAFDAVNVGINTPTDTAACRITRAYVIPNRAPSDADLVAMTA